MGRCTQPTEERWLPVVGYEGIYEVSSHGRVRSLDRVVLRSNGVPQKIRGRMRRLTVGARDYPHVSCTRQGQKLRLRYVHEMVMSAFVWPRRHGMETRHLDGDKCNSKLSNLCYGTMQENHEDRVRHGVSNRGERSGNAKTTRREVHSIFVLRGQGRTQRETAAEVGVSHEHVRDILNRKKWAWFTSVF